MGCGEGKNLFSREKKDNGADVRPPPRDTIDPCREQSIYQSRFVSGNLWLAAAAALLMGGTAGFWIGGLEMTDPVHHQLRFAAHWLVQSVDQLKIDLKIMEKPTEKK